MSASAETAAADPARGVDSRAAYLVLAFTAATALLHLAVAGRYDMFRNELYFLVCGRHPAFGYADQPPLVPLLAAATQLFGDNVWLLRLPAAAAAIALVPLTAAFVRVGGGRGTALVLAAAAAALSPALAGLTSLLTTETFEPLAWTACAYFVARAVMLGERRALLWAGLTVGLSMQAKYGIAMWLIPMVVGLLATPQRQLFAWRELWIGVGIAVVIAAPSLIWQQLHGWPFLTVVANHKQTILTGTPLQFANHQVIAMNLLLAPLWIAGIVGPFLRPGLKPLRFLSISFAGAALLDFLTGGKDYYLYAAYPTMFVLGALTCAGLRPLLAGLWLALAAVLFAIGAPVVLPLLSPPALQRYMTRLRIRQRPDELAAIGAPLTQVYSDEMPWRDLEKQVAAIYRSLPADERARVAIIGSNYGEAAAIDVYGPQDGLPPALSGQNQYFLWGAHGHDGSVIIQINGEERTWRRYCQQLTVAGTFGAPYAMPYENGRPIFLCHGLRANLTDTWERFKRYR
jgi:4-amino-4-deoxy-L-arabinose transferase-like glycosyltransferase